MTVAEIISNLISAGPIGVVIVLVLIFLYYMDKRDKLYTAAMDKITVSLDGLRTEQTQMRVDIKGHHESVEQMAKSVIDATRSCNIQPKQKEQKSW